MHVFNLHKRDILNLCREMSLGRNQLNSSSIRREAHRSTCYKTVIDGRTIVILIVCMYYNSTSRKPIFGD